LSTPKIYSLHRSKEGFEFSTDDGYTYNVYFIRDSIPLANPELESLLISFGFSCFPKLKPKEKKHDPRVKCTILHILSNFFKNNPNRIITYCCDTSDSRERQRKITFNKWFNEEAEKLKLKKISPNLAGNLHGAFIYSGDNIHRFDIESELEGWDPFDKEISIIEDDDVSEEDDLGFAEVIF
jgi:hypothetical protein